MRREENNSHIMYTMVILLVQHSFFCQLFKNEIRLKSPSLQQSFKMGFNLILSY